MDTLHTVLRSIKRETKAQTSHRRDHLDVFREFLDHLDRASKRRAASAMRVKAPKARRGRK
ncbi:hypothetical protein [Undibacter mobilis]|uniref:Uncharacterized protein n=1 Tax=Undibacter mobilis TaxID=2292256 RepID=A0A371B3S8_9BRAD|nr:hypothetical protein [Undibacter mobilis]RDV02157.1 hypothetical protein DXH78_16300 [Undibacter mobilis]